MIAVFKREIKAYFNTGYALLFAALYLAAQGMLLWYVNLRLGIPKFDLTLFNGVIYLQMPTALTVLLPLLSMRLFANDRKNGCDAFMRSLPISAADIVLGKYLALIAVYTIPVALSCALPPLLTLFTEEKLKLGGIYASIFAYWLLGCALLAICAYFSSLFKNRWPAALSGFGALAFIYLTDAYAYKLPDGTVWSFLAIALICLLAAGLCYLISRNYLATAVSGCVLLIPLALLYLFCTDGFEGLFARLIQKYGVFSRLGNRFIGYELFDIPTLLIYAAIAGFFVFITVREVGSARRANGGAAK